MKKRAKAKRSKTAQQAVARVFKFSEQLRGRLGWSSRAKEVAFHWADMLNDVDELRRELARAGSRSSKSLRELLDYLTTHWSYHLAALRRLNVKKPVRRKKR